MPVESVVVAIAAEVQETSGCCEKIEGGFRVRGARLRRRGAFPRPALLLLQMAKQQQPLSELVVAKAARALLDVRFQMEDRVAVLGVAGAGRFGQLLGDGAPFAEQQSGEQLALEAAIERSVAAEKAPIQDGDDEFQIVRVGPFALFQGPHGGTDMKSYVPEGLIARANGLAKFAFGVFVRKDIKKIDVGIRKELTPAVAAGRNDGRSGAIESLAQRAFPDQFEECVDRDGAPPNHGRAIA